MAPIRKTAGLVDIPKAVPTLPEFFDKSRLESAEFDKYIYDIKFKKTGKIVHGMTAGGHIHALHPFLKEIRSELVDFGYAGGGKRNVLSCIVKATVTLEYKTANSDELRHVVVDAFGESDLSEAPQGSLIRTAETRALNRALERLDDVSKADLNNEFIGEDEYGAMAQTEVDDNNRRIKSPQERKAELEKRYYPGDELDADQAPDGDAVERDSGKQPSHYTTPDAPLDW